MITNEERKKIAKSLKEYKREYPYWLSNGGILGLVIKHILNVESDKEALKKLTDLIEPEPERKAKSKPFPIEKDTGYFDTTKCECGYLNDVSATYCGQCGGLIEVVYE